MRQKAYGMTPCDDGSYLFATCEKHEGSWRLLPAKRWSSDNALKNVLLFCRIADFPEITDEAAVQLFVNK